MNTQRNFDCITFSKITPKSFNYTSVEVNSISSPESLREKKKIIAKSQNVLSNWCKFKKARKEFIIIFFYTQMMSQQHKLHNGVCKRNSFLNLKSSIYQGVFSLDLMSIEVPYHIMLNNTLTKDDNLDYDTMT